MHSYLHHMADTHPSQFSNSVSTNASNFNFKNTAGGIKTDTRGYVRLTCYQSDPPSVARRELLDQVIAALQLTGWTKVLVDQRRQLPYSEQDEAWILLDWLPRAVTQSGYRHVAILPSSKHLVRLHTYHLQTEARARYRVVSRIFEEGEDAASAWLLT
ncbi:hypothetical protein SAMN06269173_101168 [Hymenobacter mucosus]|uniref:SpoIIAA-like n=2 Tax=Hymenobacter mucosus TaxID=1411120 RepID=A0A238V557_9BACT|nr:hypothetical protein SAMN06269173_101168 [Hymenobacter mucosus]